MKEQKQHDRTPVFLMWRMLFAWEPEKCFHRYQSVEVVDKASTGYTINMKELPHVLCCRSSLHGAQRADICASSTVIVFAVVCTPNKTQLNRNNFEHDGWVVYTLLCNNRTKSSRGCCTQLSSKKTLFFFHAFSQKEQKTNCVTLNLTEAPKNHRARIMWPEFWLYGPGTVWGL